MNEFLKKELADLQLFADPFEEFKSGSRADGWTASFVRKGEEISIQRESNGAIRKLAGPGQQRYRNFKGLLVSETFANLERLASCPDASHRESCRSGYRMPETILAGRGRDPSERRPRRAPDVRSRLRHAGTV